MDKRDMDEINTAIAEMEAMCAYEMSHEMRLRITELYVKAYMLRLMNNHKQVNRS
jgi:hypothetical protein